MGDGSAIQSTCYESTRTQVPTQLPPKTWPLSWLPVNPSVGGYREVDPRSSLPLPASLAKSELQAQGEITPGKKKGGGWQKKTCNVLTYLLLCVHTHAYTEHRNCKKMDCLLLVMLSHGHEMDSRRFGSTATLYYGQKWWRINETQLK